MSRLEALCRQYTAIEPEDLARLCALEAELPLIADLTNADIFLDTPLDAERAIVLAQARPTQGISAYEKDIVGEYALEEKEPAVFHALRMGVPVCDIKAITQENQVVRQNVVPVRGKAGAIIAVLIREQDISAQLRQERKFEALARNYEEQAPSVRSTRGVDLDNSLAMREMHHRVKNNLQLVASILNMQARRLPSTELQDVFRENVSRVLSISTIHDILCTSDEMDEIGGMALLERLQRHLRALIPPDKEIELLVDGDKIVLQSDVATSVSLVITELVTNALLHAFTDRERGRVLISMRQGNLFHTVNVCDDGCGFDVQKVQSGLGLMIVRTTVQDKLKGRLHICSDVQGTRVSFDFKTE
jgi:two-component sensor histidine kinase